MLSLGGIIGSGWLFAAAGAVTLAGPAAIFAWLIGGIIVLFIALVYAELGGMIPRSGAIVRYGGYSHGSFAGYMFGWAYFLSAVSVPPIEAEAVITYAGTYINGLVYPNGVLTAEGIVLAMLLTGLFFALNYVGIRVMGKVNTGITWWKLIIPAGTVVALFVAGFNASNFTLATGFVSYGWPAVFSSISLAGIIFSFLGFRQALDYGGEAKNPQRSIPIATISSVLIGIALYTLLQVVFIGHVTWPAGVSVGDWSALSGPIITAPFATAASAAGLVALTYILYADAYVSPSGTLNVYLGTSQRTLYGLATLKSLPASLTRVHERFRVPILPLVISTLVGFLFFAPFPSWYKLVGFISSSTVFTYIVGGSALMVLRKHGSELKRPFRLAGSSIISPIAFVGASLIVYWSGWPVVGYVAAAIFLGLIVYGVLAALNRKDVINIFTSQALKAGIWVPAYIVALVVLSYIGEAGYGGIGVLNFPVDFIAVIVVSLIFYAWSVMSGYRTSEIEQMVGQGTQFVAAESSGAPADQKSGQQ
jgi:amino acid transporter